ncbi:hypothetical protein [Saccharopolyspora sp. NPDC002376]
MSARQKHVQHFMMLVSYPSRQCISLRSSLTAANHRFVEVINETEDHSIGTREGDYRAAQRPLS